MWVFDGEEWEQDGVSEDKRKPESMTVPYDLFLPELQVVEIVQVPKDRMPPFPMP